MKMKLVWKAFSPEDGDGQTPPPEGTPKGEQKPAPKSTLELAKALEEAKKNSVSKEEYDRVVKENEDLVNQIINGEGGNGNGQTPPEEVDIDELRKELYGPKGKNLSNLDYWKKTLKLRQAVIDKDHYDPFLNHGANIKPTETEAQQAQNVADVVQQCIDECGGDSNVFTALLQSKIANDSPTLTAHLTKLGYIK